MSLMDDDLHDPEFYSDEPHLDEYCIHEDDPRTCPVVGCNPAAEKAAMEESDHEVGPAFTARFDGFCRAPLCGGPIDVGETVHMVDGFAWHQDCVMNTIM